LRIGAFRVATKSSAFDSVVVDFSGVLVSHTSPILDELASWHRVPVETLVQVLMGPRGWSTADHPWHRAERGELPAALLQAEVVPYATAAGLTLRGDEYAHLLMGDFAVNGEVVERIGRLRGLGYSLGLLMNSLRELREAIEGRIDFGVFDAVVDSSEVGCRKPEPEIFAIMEQQLGVEPSRILYLDDVIANVSAAYNAGWATIYVSDLFDALQDLDRVSIVEQLWAPPVSFAPPAPPSGGGSGEDGGGLGEDLLGGGAGREDGGDAGRPQLVEVVVGDDPADDDRDVAPAPADLLDDQGGERHVGAGQHGQPDRVDVLVDGGGGNHLGSLEQPGVDDLVPGVPQYARDDLDPPVVPVEPDFGDQDPGGH
jgi:epoxide hydrolase-like predicted phosphatase